VDDPVEDGLGKGRLADQVVPAVDRDLAGDQRGAAAVALFDDFQHVVALLRPKRLEAPIVEDQQLDATERAHQTRVAAVAAGEREIAKHPRDALIEHRSVVAAGFVAEGTGKPAFADTRGSFDDQVLRLVDPAAGDQCLEQRSVEAAGGAIIDVFDRRLVAQPGIAQPSPQLPIVALGGFAIEQEAEPFGVREIGALRVGLQLGEGARHAGEPELVHLVEGRMGQPDQASSMVVAGTTDVWVIRQQLALRGRPGRTPIESMLEDRLDRAVVCVFR
jgi:hypothetical protein